jgi:hypothetical protein
VQQAVHALCHDVTKLLHRGALRIGEWIIAKLSCVPARPAKATLNRIVIEKEPVLIIDFREERNGLGSVYRQERTADEDILIFSRFPVSMTDD